MSHPAWTAPGLTRFPAADRNKGPILEVLRRWLPSTARVLEIASGVGQHAAWFAHHEPGWTWFPTDANPERLPLLQAWVDAVGAPNLQAPRVLDVRGPWPDVGPLDAIQCTNMAHIAPWDCTLALLDGAAAHLRPGGDLMVYGPWRIRGVHTSEGNVRFDATLRDRDPAWGIRDIAALEQALLGRPLTLTEFTPMPANNRMLRVRRT